MNKLNLLNKLKGSELDRKKIFLVATIFLLVFYIDSKSLIKLQLKGIKTQSPKIIKLKQDINNLAKDLTAMQDLKNKQIAGRKDAALKSKKIITREEMPLLFKDISDLANRNQVKLIKISPFKESKSEEEKIVLDLTCDYHHLGVFINALENAEKFISIEEMKITTDTINYFQQNIKLVLNPHVKK